jgi:signal transduction histidine kinase
VDLGTETTLDFGRLARDHAAQQQALKALLATSAHLRAGGDSSAFYRLLTASVAELVGARRVLFWQLNPDRTLIAIPGGFGIDDEFIARLAPAPCDPEGTDLTSRVVYKDLIFKATLRDADESDRDRRVLERLHVRDAISAPWRAGDERLGMVAAYDSTRPDGFTPDDAWVLQITGHAAGLVWQLKQAEAQLGQAVERLQKIDNARSLLLKNLSTAADGATKRFATELHDEALQKLTAAELELARVTSANGTGPHGPGIHRAQELLGDVEDALRRLLFNVRPPALEAESGLEEAVRERIERLRLAPDVTIEIEVEVPVDPPYEIKTTLYRQVSEALANVEKHATPQRVRVVLKSENGGIYGAVIDDGCGFIVSERSQLPGHLGLLALNERALLAGGWNKVISEPGAGTTVEFWVPVV